MNQKPYDITKETATNIIYDTLMQNVGDTYQQLNVGDVELQEVDAKQGYLYFDIGTEKGLKRVHVHVTVEDIE